MIPSRIAELMKRIEAGEPVTQEYVNRLAALQALDIAKAGEDFARRAIEADAEQSKLLLEAPK